MGRLQDYNFHPTLIFSLHNIIT